MRSRDKVSLENVSAKKLYSSFQNKCNILEQKVAESQELNKVYKISNIVQTRIGHNLVSPRKSFL